MIFSSGWEGAGPSRGVTDDEQVGALQTLGCTYT